MKRNPTCENRPRPGREADETRDVDAEYGLEPVFDPTGGEDAQAAVSPAQLRRVQCPYCGESFHTLVDLSVGSSAYVEDCRVCCRPIEFTLDVDPMGAFAGLSVRRDD